LPWLEKGSSIDCAIYLFRVKLHDYADAHENTLISLLLICEERELNRKQEEAREGNKRRNEGLPGKKEKDSATQID